MKEGFKIALKIFKYLTVLFAIVYWVGIIIDDWVFIEKYWKENWLEYILGWFVWFLIFFVGYSLIYWSTAVIVNLIYFKFILRLKKNETVLKQ